MSEHVDSLDLELEEFLTPAPGIQCEHPEVRKLARELARGGKNDVEAARRLFDHVRDSVAYSVGVPVASLEDYLALNTLARGKGFCVQKSALLCALARSLGIPARLGFADIKNEKLHGFLAQSVPDGIIYHHCFTEWFVGGRWLKATTSFDRKLSERHGWRLVEFDPMADALLPATDLKGRPHVTYLAYHGWRLGVPLAEFSEVTDRRYGAGAMAAWDARGRAAAGGGDEE
jgi:transglutaminase-like putative cysteine protease